MCFKNIILFFCCVGDSMGSVIGYDALCRSPDSHVQHETSRHSTPEHAQKKNDNGILKNIES